MTLAAVMPLLLSALACTARKAPAHVDTATRILVVKSTHMMTLFSGSKILKTYKIALGRESGPKRCAGDHKVPEGEYVIDSRNPLSRFHLALHVSYPNAADRERAARLGCPAGGNIEIHGVESSYAWLGRFQRLADWTDGCVAVSDSEIEEIYRMVPVGTPTVFTAPPRIA
jgi:murein L,D-transpeptidase YafK